MREKVKTFYEAMDALEVILTPDQRKIIAMKARGKTYDQIGDRLGISKQAARQNHLRAMQKIKDKEET